MSTVKVTSSAPVGHQTPMMKLASAKLASASPSPISAITDSAGTGSTTDQPLPNDQQPFEKIPYVLLPEEEVSLQPFVTAETVVPFEEEETPEVLNAPSGAFYSPQDAARQVSTYEQARDVVETPIKKSTKAFG